MKLSRPTLDEIIGVLKETYIDSNAKASQFISRFELGETTAPSINKKIEAIIESLVQKEEIHKDVLEFALRMYYVKYPSAGTSGMFDTKVKVDDIHETYPHLITHLKANGYLIRNRTIISALPKELETSALQDELDILLTKFELTTAKGHLDQALSNFRDSNWASSNSQIRTFFESVLLFIAKKIDPSFNKTMARGAITTLSGSFFKVELNEVNSNGSPNGFILGISSILHPDGSHPGLSGEADSTFRLHLIIATANYYLKRLDKQLEE